MNSRRLSNDCQSDLTVAQWNILADGLANDYCYPYQKGTQVVSFPQRAIQIVSHISDRNPDVICLEELNHPDLFQSLFKEKGYDRFIHLSKQKSVMEGAPIDGIAIVFKSTTFGQPRPEVKNYYRDENGGLANQGLLLVPLFHKLVSKELIVGVTHLKAKKGFQSIRKGQVSQAIKWIQDSSRQSIPVIFCGDFNTALGYEEDAYQDMIANGFHDSYEMKPEWSTWKKRLGKSNEWELKKEVEDYIFFKGLQRRAVLDIPNDIDQEYLLPCPTFPSDHIDLVAKFDFE